MLEKIQTITQLTLDFLQDHAVGERIGDKPISGAFALHRGQTEPDLYGMVDAVYTLAIVGKMPAFTTSQSRQQWANGILACQDEQGWFSKQNKRGHSREHATAYALGALALLQVDANEEYVSQIRPLNFLRPLMTDRQAFNHWFKRLGFQYSLREIKNKNLGWHYIWRSSHIGGGIAACVGMAKHLIPQWWHDGVSPNEWLSDWYFPWLDQRVNPKSGYWQRGLWNKFYRRPTLIDMAGAVHFYWIYAACQRPLPYPEAIIQATLPLQRESGLYKKHPFCIDLDGNFCLTRPFHQLPPTQQATYHDAIHQSLERNFAGIVHALTTEPWVNIYNDSHGLPGALAGLVECAKLPDFVYADAVQDWQNPFDKAWWL